MIFRKRWFHILVLGHKTQSMPNGPAGATTLCSCGFFWRH